MNTENENSVISSIILAILPIAPLSLALQSGAVAVGALVATGLAGLAYIEIRNENGISRYSSLKPKGSRKESHNPSLNA